VNNRTPPHGAETGLDRKTIRAILNGKKVKASTLAKMVMGLREESKN
jgi:hypothetical protein